LKENDRGSATLYRFRLQIRSAADSVWGMYRYTVEREDTRQEAALFTLEYLESGVLAGIERKAGGNPHQIDRYFLRELKCDLLNWAKGIHRAKQRERLLSPVRISDIRTRLLVVSDPYDEVDIRMSWPLLSMRAFDDMSVKEIAKEQNVSLRTAHRMLAKEKEDAKKFYFA
jgi:hypothetical protein